MCLDKQTQCHLWLFKLYHILHQQNILNLPSECRNTGWLWLVRAFSAATTLVKMTTEITFLIFFLLSTLNTCRIFYNYCDPIKIGHFIFLMFKTLRRLPIVFKIKSKVHIMADKALKSIKFRNLYIHIFYIFLSQVFYFSHPDLLQFPWSLPSKFLLQGPCQSSTWNSFIPRIQRLSKFICISAEMSLSQRAHPKLPYIKIYVCICVVYICQ